MVSKDDVRAAYRLILGREPENEEVVTRHAQQANSLADLRKVFLSSPEFQRLAVVQLPFRPLNWPAIEVEIDANPGQLSAMTQHIEANWQRLGLVEPHWSVFTHEQFLASNIQGKEEIFYDSGKGYNEVLRHTAERCGVVLSDFTRCFELGCGVGRLTIWLADLFERVVAADISRSHLTHARQAVARLRRTNVDFLHIDSFDAIGSAPDFDVFISVIVLQHNPPPLIGALLRSFLNKLRPGGIAYFQVPTYCPGYRFQIDEYLRSAALKSNTEIEMHIIPQDRLFDIIKQSGCVLLEIREDPYVAGIPDMISNSVFARKQGNAATATLRG